MATDRPFVIFDFLTWKCKQENLEFCFDTSKKPFLNNLEWQVIFETVAKKLYARKNANKADTSPKE